MIHDIYMFAISTREHFMVSIRVYKLRFDMVAFVNAYNCTSILLQYKVRLIICANKSQTTSPNKLYFPLICGVLIMDLYHARHVI